MGVETIDDLCWESVCQQCCLSAVLSVSSAGCQQCWLMLLFSPGVYELRSVGDGSVVEPAPPDTQVLRGCGFKSHCSPPAGPSCHRCAPTCLKTETNLARIWYMA